MALSRDGTTPWGGRDCNADLHRPRVAQIQTELGRVRTHEETLSFDSKRLFLVPKVWSTVHQDIAIQPQCLHNHCDQQQLQVGS